MASPRGFLPAANGCPSRGRNAPLPRSMAMKKRTEVRFPSNMDLLSALAPTRYESEQAKTGEQHRIGLGLGHRRDRVAGEREHGVERALVGDVGADAQPVGIEGGIANPALQVG